MLVGGEGTRLRPLTCNTVKAMVPILNRPFFEHLLDYLATNGVDDIITTLCYLPDRIENRFGDGTGWGARLTYVMEKEPLGTAGAVKNAEPHLDGTFCVFNGDIITSIDLRGMLAFHRQHKAKVTIALTPVEDPSAYGVVVTTGEGRVTDFIEKPPRDEAPTNRINAGIYVIEPEVLDGVPAGKPFMFERHLFPTLLEKGAAVYGYPTRDYWIDIGTPEKYRQVQYDILEGKCASSLGRRIMEKEMKPGEAVHPSAVVEGPVVFGTGCRIGAGVRIKGPAVLGDGCTISDSATIHGAILWRNVRVGRGATIREATLGEGCYVGEGSTVEPGSVLGDNAVVTDGNRVQTNQKVWPDTTI